MKRQSYGQGNNLKIVICALGVILLLGVGFLFVHDINIPAEHTTAEIAVSLEK